MVRPALFAVVLLAVPVPALAQADVAAQARVAAANQVGVLQYCESKGFSGMDAVAAQRESMARLPAGGATGDAEEVGRTGMMVAGNERLPLAEIAALHHIEVPALCRQMADSVMRADAMLKQNGASAGGIPGLPALSGMPTVPGIAALPGTPTMPGVAPAR